MVIRKIPRFALFKAGLLLHRAAGMIYQSPVELRVAAWRAANGDQTLRLDYPLSQSSVVFDLGGFEGQWTSDIYSRYRCKVFVFEPVLQYAEAIRYRFKCNPDVAVFDFGLSGENRTEILHLAGNASSSLQRPRHARGDTVAIKMQRADTFLSQSGVSKIALMKINIEGGEYDLLEHLIDTELVDRIDNIQVQFHDFVPDANERMARIQYSLRMTHEPTYSFPFVWENWRRHA